MLSRQPEHRSGHYAYRLVKEALPAVVAALMVVPPTGLSGQECPYHEYQEFTQAILSSHAIFEATQSARTGQSDIIGQLLSGLAEENRKKVVADARVAVGRCPEFARTFIEKGLNHSTSSDPLERALTGLLMRGMTQGDPEMAAAIRRAQAWVASLR